MLLPEAEQLPEGECFREMLQIHREAWGGGDFRGGQGCSAQQHLRRQSSLGLLVWVCQSFLPDSGSCVP